jgi:hypothetical protein
LYLNLKIDYVFLFLEKRKQKKTGMSMIKKQTKIIEGDNYLVIRKNGVVISIKNKFDRYIYEEKNNVKVYYIGDLACKVSEDFEYVEGFSEFLFPFWKPENFGLIYPVKLKRKMNYTFLHIYFLLKNILGKKIQSKDLRQYVFGFIKID